MDYLQNLCNPGRMPTLADCQMFRQELLESQRPWKEVVVGISKQPRVSGVYGLMRDGDLSYIGKSLHVYNRLQEHAVYRRLPFTSVGIVPVDCEHLELVEYRLIRLLKPPRNVMWKTRRSSWGKLPIDELAEVLNVPPFELLAACKQNSVELASQNRVDIKQALWHFARR